jgi:hypothetical protein
MENDMKYMNQCPSVQDFESILQNNATETLRLDFHRHLDDCELCSLAFEGYQLANINTISDKLQLTATVEVKKHPVRMLAYAATILVVVGSYFFFQQMERRNTTLDPLFVSDAYTEFEEINTGSKKLMAKNQEDYWHVNANGDLSLNDQAIAIEQIDDANLEEGKKAFIELGSVENEAFESLIKKLKVEKNQKVFTLAKNRNLNPSI